ncbi:MAG: M23 family metallopeptidase, partial [Gammaproteobacteria bacterium]
LCLSALVGACFLAGVEYAAKRSEDIVAYIREQSDSVWQEEMRSQRESLNRVKANAEKSLDAMASRLSLLQGHVMRLDALGSRLAAMAMLDEMEFSFDNPPGMGGPAPAGIAENPIDIPDFLKSIKELEAGLQDKTEKLAAMESMLMDRTLQEQTLPDGRLAKSGWISSLYGFRTDPISGRREFHQGIDVAGRPETPITAVAAGIVTWSGMRYGYGNLVEISHGNGYLTRYAHNRKNLVSVGEKVEKGEIVALMGSSGHSTGTHVHFEVARYGKFLDPKRHISIQ